MFSFIAGKMTKGHLAANAAEVKRLSQIPPEILARVLAVQGAITKTSAQFVKDM